MPKVTKTLGYIKAPACESRGFVTIKREHHFDTPSSFFVHNPSYSTLYYKIICYLCAVIFNFEE